MRACRLCGVWGRSGGFEVGFLFPVREGETQEALWVMEGQVQIQNS